MLYSGHLSTADKRFWPKISLYWSKSHKHDLCKADTCTKRTKMVAPKVSALDRFHCTCKSWQTCVFRLNRDHVKWLNEVYRLLVWAPENLWITEKVKSIEKSETRPTYSGSLGLTVFPPGFYMTPSRSVQNHSQSASAVEALWLLVSAI